MKNKLGLYIHIPFCVRKCYYCDFLSMSATDNVIQHYLDSLCQEMELWGKDLLKESWEIDTIFIGGGTPSILSIENCSRMIESIQSNFSVCDDAEITLECNPGTVTKEKLSHYRNHGINRLSIGMQSTVDDELQKLGRIHSYNQFVTTFTMAREAGFENINIDIMAAIPGQTKKSYDITLQRVLQHKPEHISSYSLIIEEGTPFYEKYKDVPPVDEETDRIMYERTEELLLANGYHRYEISNYAKPGYECKHNMKYWQREEYIGVGLGASSYFAGKRFHNLSQLEDYEVAIQKGAKPIAETEVLTKREAMAEFMYLGLRCMEGVSEEKFFQCFDVPLKEVYGTTIEYYEKQNLLTKKDKQIALTKKGIDVSNMIFADFL